MLGAALVVLAAVGLATLTYLRLERVGAAGWVPLACRAVAWSALGLLLLNVSCPVATPPRRPLVLLDASLSLGAAGGRWSAAHDSAARWGDVRRFGDERPTDDTFPSHGRSLLGPALTAASASDRLVLVVTDGEIDDAADLPPDLVARAGVRLFPRAATPDLAIIDVGGPTRVTAGDSIELDAEVDALNGATADSVTVEVSLGGKRLAGRRVRLSHGRARVRLGFSSAVLGAGEHVLHVSLRDAADPEPRTDTRLHLVTVAPTPGVVLLAGPADWDSRFLYRTVREVAQLPVRGFVRLDRDRWRAMADLRLVPGETVRQVARHADLLILMGAVAPLGEGTSARGVWRWPAASDSSAQPGDWYLTATGASPVAGAFLGQPMDSFPPAVQLVPLVPGPSDWIALAAQLGRRGATQPAVMGRETGRSRQVTVGVDGLWRWAFRGGSSEQTYRTWVATSTSWLLGGADSARGAARTARPVVENGRPLIFQWVAPSPPVPLAVSWSSATEAPRTDTLRFDGSGRAPVWLPPGEYRYRLSGGGGGTVAVERFSEELLPRAPTISAHEGRGPRPLGRRSARDWIWLFALCILGLSGEWFARRRLGLR